MKLLEVKDLIVEFKTARGILRAVDRVSFDVAEGETLGIVGESGCGKSITSLALMGLLPPHGRIAGGQILFRGQELVSLAERERRKIRGGKIGMIFQDPMSSLNPALSVGYQLIETIQTHEGGSRASLQSRAVELLKQVGIPAPEERLKSYPHQLSGGMSQRVMIAIAIACRPKLLIADEPTTALDVTIQAQILELLRRLQREHGMGLILITHDLSVVAETAERASVMYAGQIVETGPIARIIDHASHPYTRALLDSLPSAHPELAPRSKLPALRGLVPDLLHRPSGCQMNPRCPIATESCEVSEPKLIPIFEGQWARCIRPIGMSEGSNS